uniref:Uncharacterized protein n=1 Tax=Strongyloides papillosus TaxID=174720 RepID=A0A0N5CHB7_STREA
MAVAHERARQLRSFNESSDFCESKIISDSKITRRRKNSKRNAVPSGDTTVTDTFLSDNSLKAESARENGTFAEKENVSPGINEECSEDRFDDTLVLCKVTAKSA